MISLILMCLAGICKAIQDTLQFHFDKSIFTKGNKFFWNPQLSYLNKYKVETSAITGLPVVNLDKEKFLGSSTVFVAFTDGWHLFGMLNHFLICAAIVLYSPITPIKIKVLSILVDFLIIKIAHQSIFHAFYTWIFARKK